jgi:hypothetical protein
MANQSQRQAFRRWDKLLNPEKLRTNLAKASAFLSAYELLRASVVDKPREFFLSGPCGQKDSTDPKYAKYRAEVVALFPQDVFRASCLWFSSLGAITPDDVKLLGAIRHHRNDIAHELPKYLIEPAHQVDAELFDSICSLLCKVDRWWIQEVEIPTDSGSEWRSPESAPDDQILSVAMVVIRIIQAMFQGREADVAEVHDLLVEEWKESRCLSVTALANDAVCEALSEDIQDLEAFEERAGESLISYDEMVKRLKKDGSV